MKNIILNKKIIIFLLTIFMVFGMYSGNNLKSKQLISGSNFFVPTIVQAIELNIGQAAQDAEVPGTADYDSDDPEGGFGNFVGNILNIIITVGALLVLLNLLWGAIQWIISGGDKGKLESARNRMTQSIIGLIVLVSVLAIFMMIQNFLGLEVLQFSGNNSQSQTSTEQLPLQEVGHGHELE